MAAGAFLLTVATATLALVAELGEATSRKRPEGRREPAALIPTIQELGWQELQQERPRPSRGQASSASRSIVLRPAPARELPGLLPPGSPAPTRELPGLLPPQSPAPARALPILVPPWPPAPHWDEARQTAAPRPAGVPRSSEQLAVRRSGAALQERVPLEAQVAWALARPRLETTPERQLLQASLSILASAAQGERAWFWRRKEALLAMLARLGADTAMVAAALLYDVEAELGLPWASVRPRVVGLGRLGATAAALVDGKQRFGRLASLFYLRASEPDPPGEERWPAVAQLVRQLSLQATSDYRVLLLELTTAALGLGERVAAEAAVTGGPALQPPSRAARALARTALELHAPLAHVLGLDSLARAGGSAGLLPLPHCWTLSGTLEHLGLRLLYPAQYRVVLDWFDRELGLLERTLAEAAAVVRAALDSCRRFGALAAGYELNHRVKSPQSLMKKLLQGRRVNDLLGMEVVVIPSDRAPLPSGPASRTGLPVGAACCFAAAAALQRFVSRGKVSWVVAPGSFKDYVRQPKSSGYQAIHLALVTDIFASPMQPAPADVVQGARSERAAAIVRSAPCQLELHILTAEMKRNEQCGLASHASYKAFPLRPQAILEALDSRGEGAVRLEELAHAAFPLATGAVVDVLGDLVERAGFDIAGEDAFLSLADLQRSRQDVDVTVAGLQEGLAGLAGGHGSRPLAALPPPREPPVD